MRLYESEKHDRDRPHAISVSDADDCVSETGHEPIRVLHVAQSIAGGVASYFEELAAYQTKAFGKANVSFLIPSGSETHLPNIDPAQVLTFSRTSRRPGALLSFGRSASDAVRRLRPDVLHLHSSFAGAFVRPFLRSKGRKPRIIYSPHGWAFGMEVSRIRKLAYAAVERHLAARTDLILVNSGSEHGLAVRFGLPAQKLKMIENGIAWAPPADRRRGAERIRLAFIGRHDPQKGLDILLDAIERFSLPNMEFHIVGASIVGPAISGTPERSNVTFHGWLGRVEMVQLLHQVDALVMPSRWEAFGLVAIEAMRAGVAVIGSNRGALPEVIKHGVGGYIFDIDDPGSLGRLLQQLDPTELRRLGDSARSHWEREYVADRMNHLTRQAYASVLSSRIS